MLDILGLLAAPRNIQEMGCYFDSAQIFATLNVFCLEYSVMGLTEVLVYYVLGSK